jgi:uncharacterized membrane protein
VSAMLLFSRAKGSSWKKWLWIAVPAVAGIAALQMYFVQEMIAALFLFTLLFVIVAAIVLVLWAVDRAGQRTVAWAEPQTRHVAQLARRGVAAVEERGRKWTHTGDAHP